MSSVLFDVPGPQARRRQRLVSAGVVAVLLALAYLAYRRMADNDQFTADKWEVFVTPDFVSALGSAAVTTLRVAAVSIVLSIVFGALFAVGRLSDHRAVRYVSGLVVEFFRAVPVLMMIFALNIGYSEDIGKFWCLVIPLVLYNGSVLAEVFRAGIKAVPAGQSEAAYALGMRKTQVMVGILLPQAARIMLPAIVSQSVVALKDTSLGYTIGFLELTYQGRQIAVEFGNSLAAGIVLAIAYILINYTLGRLAVALERRASRSRTSATPPGGPVSEATSAT
jgi:glutamate transport system permease protein